MNNRVRLFFALVMSAMVAFAPFAEARRGDWVSTPQNINTPSGVATRTQGIAHSGGSLLWNAINTNYPGNLGANAVSAANVGSNTGLNWFVNSEPYRSITGRYYDGAYPGSTIGSGIYYDYLGFDAGYDNLYPVSGTHPLGADHGVPPYSGLQTFTDLAGNAYDESDFHDERDFVLAARIDSNGNRIANTQHPRVNLNPNKPRQMPFTHTLSDLAPGERIRVMVYMHNNGDAVGNGNTVDGQAFDVNIDLEWDQTSDASYPGTWESVSGNNEHKLRAGLSYAVQTRNESHSDWFSYTFTQQGLRLQPLGGAWLDEWDQGGGITPRLKSWTQPANSLNDGLTEAITMNVDTANSTADYTLNSSSPFGQLKPCFDDIQVLFMDFEVVADNSPPDPSVDKQVVAINGNPVTGGLTPTVQINDTISYRVFLTNSGGTAITMSAYDDLPTFMTYSSGTAVLSGSSIPDPSIAAGSPGYNRLTFNPVTIGANQTLILEYSATVNNTAAAYNDPEFCNTFTIGDRFSGLVATDDACVFYIDPAIDMVKQAIEIVDENGNVVASDPNGLPSTMAVGLGYRIRYQITAVNPGNTDVYNLVVTDNLPPFLTYINGSDNPAGSTTHNATTNQLTFDFDTLTPGQIKTITFQTEIDTDVFSQPPGQPLCNGLQGMQFNYAQYYNGTTPSSINGTYSNSTLFDVSNTQVQACFEMLSYTIEKDVVQVLDSNGNVLVGNGVDPIASSPIVAVGDQVRYRLRVTNTSSESDIIDGLVVTDTLATYFTYVSGTDSVTHSNPTGMTVPTFATTNVAGQDIVEWDDVSLPANILGGTQEYTDLFFTAEVNADAANDADGLLCNGGGRVALGDDSTVVVDGPGGLSEVDTPVCVSLDGTTSYIIDKTLSASQTTPVAVGDTVEFVITVTNTSAPFAGDITGVSVEDILPEYFEFITGTNTETVVGAGGATSFVAGPTTVTNQVLTWSNMTLAENTGSIQSQIEITFDVTVTEEAFNVTAGPPYELCNADDTVGSSVTLTSTTITGSTIFNTPVCVEFGEESYTIEKALAPGQPTEVTVGDTIDYILTLTNTSTNGFEVSDVRVRDILPSYLSYIDSANGGTNNWSETGSGTSVSFNQTGQQLEWANITIPGNTSSTVQETVEIAFSVTVNSDAANVGSPYQLCNEDVTAERIVAFTPGVVVPASGTVGIPAPVCVTYEDPGFELTKIVAPGQDPYVEVGDTVSFILQLRNTSAPAQTISNITVTDILPEYFDYEDVANGGANSQGVFTSSTLPVFTEINGLNEELEWSNITLDANDTIEIRFSVTVNSDAANVGAPYQLCNGNTAEGSTATATTGVVTAVLADPACVTYDVVDYQIQKYIIEVLDENGNQVAYDNGNPLPAPVNVGLGYQVRFGLEITNSGSSPLTDVVLRDQLGPFFTYAGNPNIAPTNVFGGPGGELITWSADSVDWDGTIAETSSAGVPTVETFTFLAEVNGTLDTDATPYTLCNDADMYVDAPASYATSSTFSVSPAPTPDLITNQACVEYEVSDYEFIKYVVAVYDQTGTRVEYDNGNAIPMPVNVQPGYEVQFAIEVRNHGNTAMNGVVIRDQLDTYYTYVPASANIQPATVNGGPGGEEIIWSENSTPVWNGIIAAAASPTVPTIETFTFRAEVNGTLAPAPNEYELCNDAELYVDVADPAVIPATADVVAPEVCPFLEIQNYDVEKFIIEVLDNAGNQIFYNGGNALALPIMVSTGDQIRYGIRVTNYGNADITGVVIEDDLEPELTYVPGSENIPAYQVNGGPGGEQIIWADDPNDANDWGGIIVAAASPTVPTIETFTFLAEVEGTVSSLDGLACNEADFYRGVTTINSVPSLTPDVVAGPVCVEIDTPELYAEKTGVSNPNGNTDVTQWGDTITYNIGYGVSSVLADAQDVVVFDAMPQGTCYEVGSLEASLTAVYGVNYTNTVVVEYTDAYPAASATPSTWTYDPAAAGYVAGDIDCAVTAFRLVYQVPVSGNMSLYQESDTPAGATQQNGEFDPNLALYTDVTNAGDRLALDLSNATGTPYVGSYTTFVQPADVLEWDNFLTQINTPVDTMLEISIRDRICDPNREFGFITATGNGTESVQVDLSGVDPEVHDELCVIIAMGTNDLAVTPTLDFFQVAYIETPAVSIEFNALVTQDGIRGTTNPNPASITNITNTVSISASNTPTVTDDHTHIMVGPMLEIVKTGISQPTNSVSQTALADTITYDVTYGNPGTQDATNVVITDMLAEGTCYEVGSLETSLTASGLLPSVVSVRYTNLIVADVTDPLDWTYTTSVTPGATDCGIAGFQVVYNAGQTLSPTQVVVTEDGSTTNPFSVNTSDYTNTQVNGTSIELVDVALPGSYRVTVNTAATGVDRWYSVSADVTEPLNTDVEAHVYAANCTTPLAMNVDLAGDFLANISAANYGTVCIEFVLRSTGAATPSLNSWMLDYYYGATETFSFDVVVDPDGLRDPAITTMPNSFTNVVMATADDVPTVDDNHTHVIQTTTTTTPGGGGGGSVPNCIDDGTCVPTGPAPFCSVNVVDLCPACIEFGGDTGIKKYVFDPNPGANDWEDREATIPLHEEGQYRVDVDLEATVFPVDYANIISARVAVYDVIVAAESDGLWDYNVRMDPYNVNGWNNDLDSDDANRFVRELTEPEIDALANGQTVTMPPLYYYNDYELELADSIDNVMNTAFAVFEIEYETVDGEVVVSIYDEIIDPSQYEEMCENFDQAILTTYGTLNAFLDRMSDSTLGDDVMVNVQRPFVSSGTGSSIGVVTTAESEKLFGTEDAELGSLVVAGDQSEYYQTDSGSITSEFIGFDAQFTGVERDAYYEQLKRTTSPVVVFGLEMEKVAGEEIYFYDGRNGDVIFDEISLASSDALVFDAPTTFIIEDADVIVDTEAFVMPGSLAAFVVRNGNLFIGTDTSVMQGIYILEGADRMVDGILTAKGFVDAYIGESYVSRVPFRLTGAIIGGDPTRFFESRVYVGEYNSDGIFVPGPAVEFEFDNRMLDGTPPAIEESLGSGWKQGVPL